jgi:hypothetical protein
VLQKRVLGRIFEPKGDEVTGNWRGLYNLYASPIIITMTESSRTRLARYVARMWSRGTHMCYWWESQKERDYYEEKKSKWVDNIKLDLGI